MILIRRYSLQILLIILCLPTLTALTDITVCGFNATSAGETYRLTANLSCGNSSGVDVLAENVTIDCMSFAIYGDNSGAAFAIYSGQNNTSVQNCGMDGFLDGIIYENSSGGFIINNTINHAGQNGIRVISGAGNTITGNTVQTNSASPAFGAISLSESDSNNISLNTADSASASDNSAPAIRLHDAPNNLFANNTLIVSSNSTPAVSASAGSGGNTFYHNSLTSQVWVDDSNGTNEYNTTDEGNIYYTLDTTPAWGVLDLINNGTNSWAVSGANWPLNATNSAGGWIGMGADWHPYTPIYSFRCGNLNQIGGAYQMSADLQINGSTCFDIVAANVTLDCNGKTIYGNNSSATAGIFSNQPGTMVKNCRIENFSIGINLSGDAADGANITNNTISITYSTSCSQTDGTCSGLFVYGGDDGWFADNQIRAYQSAIDIMGGADRNQIMRNNATASLAAILVDSSSNNTISYNNATATGDEAINIFAGTGNTVEYNNATTVNLGVWVSSGSNNTVQGNNITATGADAVFIDNSHGNLVQYNSISANNSTIFVQSDSNTLQYNTIVALGANAINVLFSSNNTIRHNNATAGGDYAVHLQAQDNSNNTFFNNTLKAGNSTNGRTVISIENETSGGNLFYANNITGSIWVSNANETNQFNTSSMGNIYYLANGTQSWDVFAILQNGSSVWASSGADRPFNHVTVRTHWAGVGQDWHPYTTKIQSPDPVPDPASGGGSSGLRYPIYLDQTFDCAKATLTITATDEYGHTVHGIDISLRKNFAETDRQTADSHGVAVFGISTDGNYNAVSLVSGPYLQGYTQPVFLKLCPAPPAPKENSASIGRNAEAGNSRGSPELSTNSAILNSSSLNKTGIGQNASDGQIDVNRTPAPSEYSQTPQYRLLSDRAMPEPAMYAPIILFSVLLAAVIGGAIFLVHKRRTRGRTAERKRR